MAEDDYRQVRKEFTESIRRKEREECIWKRRNFHQKIEVEQIEVPSSQHKYFVIVDPNYQSQIHAIITQNYSLTQLPNLITCVKSEDILQQHKGVIGIRKIISSDCNPPVQSIIDSQLIPLLLAFMSQKVYPQLKLEAAWIITNIASGTTSQCKRVIEKGGLEILMTMLYEGKEGIVEQAIWAIGNIGGDCSQLRDRIISLGGVDLFINLIKTSSSAAIVQHSSWALSNLCRGNPAPKYQFVKKSIPILAGLVIKGTLTQQNLCDVTWALSFLCQGTKPKINRIVETGVISKVIQNCKTKTMKVIVPSLRLIGNVSSGNQLHNEQLMKAGVLQLIEEMLFHVKSSLRKEVCWILSNLSAGTTSQVNQILSRPSMTDTLIKMFLSDSIEVRKEIIFIFANITNMGQPEQVYKLVSNEHVIDGFIAMLNDENTKIVEDTLTCIYTMWSIGNKFGVKPNPLVMKYSLVPGFIDHFEGLQQSTKGIYQKVRVIIQKYLLFQGTQFMQ